MSIESAILKRSQLLATIGKVGLNLNFPDEFELYMCAFEVTDDNFNTLQYFIFPVMPSSMDETHTLGTTVRKTLGGITALSTPTFMPRDIVLTGTFGRRLRTLIGAQDLDIISSFKVNENNITLQEEDSSIQKFDTRIKTGYGCVKILEEIVESCNKIDPNTRRMKRILFHNLASGNSYLIKPMMMKLSTSQESNMIWSYSLQLKGIAPLKSIIDNKRLDNDRFKLVVGGYAQKAADRAINLLTQYL